MGRCRFRTPYGRYTTCRGVALSRAVNAVNVAPPPPPPDQAYVYISAWTTKGVTPNYKQGPAEAEPTESQGKGITLEITDVGPPDNPTGVIGLRGITLTSFGSGYAEKEVLRVTQGGVWGGATVTVESCGAKTPCGLGYTLCAGDGTTPCIAKVSGVAWGGGGGTCGEWRDPADWIARFDPKELPKIQQRWGPNGTCPPAYAARC